MQVGINESLTVNLEMLCDCDCERSDSVNQAFEEKSDKCDKHGDLSCGICACYEGYFGKQCECGTNDRGQSNINELACRRDNTTTYDCSGRGSCECNVCNCYGREDPNEVREFFVKAANDVFVYLRRTERFGSFIEQLFSSKRFSERNSSYRNSYICQSYKIRLMLVL